MDMSEKRLSEVAERASERCYVTFSDFLNMEDQSELSSLALPCDYVTFGGYDGAERAVAAFGNGCEYAEFPIKIVEAAPLSQKFADKLLHRDFLGSLMGLGIKRSVLGDIVVLIQLQIMWCKILIKCATPALNAVLCKICLQVPWQSRRKKK